MPANTHPILSIDQARDLAGRLFAGDETREWPAMQAAGRSLALAILTDYSEIGTFPQAARLLVLAGKGHNAGDALIACSVILDKFPGASAQVVFVYGERSLRPLARRAWVELLERYPGRVGTLSPRTLPVPGDYTLSIDGIYGFRYRPPLDAAAHVVLTWEAAQTVDLRAAVDLPSGLDAVGAFQADFTYATGIVKRVLLTLPNAGRLRYLDLGFFPDWQH